MARSSDDSSTRQQGTPGLGDTEKVRGIVSIVEEPRISRATLEALGELRCANLASS